MVIYHTGIFALDTPAKDAAIASGNTSFVIKGGLVTGRQKIKATISRLQRERPGFSSSYDGGESMVIANEVRISSPTMEEAEAVAHTLLAAMAVSDGNCMFVPSGELDVTTVEGGSVPFAMSRQMLRPVQLAVSVRADARLHYALHRLALSYLSASVHHVDLDPIGSPRNFSPSADPYVHVHLANAISLAYSAIEQLDLHVKASQKDPSKLPDGSWNPKVRENIEQRLRGRNIDFVEPQMWSLRGPPTAIEIRKSPPQSRLPPRWQNPDVRDRDLDLLDCINLAGWFRNNLGAHGLSLDLVPHLTIYDVFNVQHVARRLVMASAGLW